MRMCVCNGGSEGSVWTGRVSTINPASDLQATALLTLSHNPIGTSSFTIGLKSTQRILLLVPLDFTTSSQTGTLRFFLYPVLHSFTLCQ